MNETIWDGRIASDIKTGDMTLEQIESMSRLCQYVFDRGLISVRKGAEIMKCVIDDITTGV